MALCIQCDVAGWLHALLSREGRLDLVGERVAERLAEFRSRMQRDNLLLLARAEQALDLLLGAGITPLALKGLDALHRLYERFDERGLDDVDLLLRPDELRPALDLLLSAGWELPPGDSPTHYIRSSHHLPLRSAGPVHVEFEIHWNLVQEMRFRVDQDGLFRRAVPLEVSGRRILRLADEDLAAHLLLHHFTHYFDSRLKWAVDLQALVNRPGFRWAAVVDRVRDWDAAVACGISLVHLKKLIPDVIPQEALDGLPIAPWRRLMTWPLRSRHPLELYRHTRNRRVQLYLAAVLLEHPGFLPAWVRHRARRDLRPGAHPLERPGASPVPRRAGTDQPGAD